MRRVYLAPAIANAENIIHIRGDLNDLMYRVKANCVPVYNATLVGTENESYMERHIVSYSGTSYIEFIFPDSASLESVLVYIEASDGVDLQVFAGPSIASLTPVELISWGEMNGGV